MTRAGSRGPRASGFASASQAGRVIGAGAGAGVTIRPAFPDDADAVARLARLDSQRPPRPSTPLLLAEIDGVPWAAIALGAGRLYADPFRPTAAMADLLRRRAAQLAALEEERRRRAAPLTARDARRAVA